MSQLMTSADLEAVTGLKRYSKQVDWFRRTFGADVARRDDGSIVMTWATYEALSAKRAGVAPAARTDSHVELCYD